METEKNIESPFVEEVTPSVDLDKLSEERMNSAVVDILKILGNNTDSLVYPNDTTQDVVSEKQSKVAMEILNSLSDHKVFHRDLKMITEIMQATIYMLFNSVSRVYNEYEKELLARAIEARNPLDNKLSREYATIEDMFNKLEQMRKAQDKEGDSEYFTVKSKQE